MLQRGCRTRLRTPTCVEVHRTRTCVEVHRRGIRNAAVASRCSIVLAIFMMMIVVAVMMVKWGDAYVVGYDGDNGSVDSDSTHVVCSVIDHTNN